MPIRIAVRTFGVSIAAVCLLLLALHVSPTARFWVQEQIVDVEAPTKEAIISVIGVPYVMHNAADDITLRVSLAFKAPTRYVRDIWFWMKFRDGEPFAVEALNENPYGITHIFFKRDENYRRLVMSLPTRRAVCIANLKAWDVKVEGEKTAPVYVLDASNYVMTLITDGSEKWRAVEHSC